MHRPPLYALLLATSVFVGCQPTTAPPAVEESGLPKAAVTLRVAVVEDDSLRRTIDRLRGEWQTLTEGQIETFAVATIEAATEADLIVFPSRALGSLCEAGRLRPIRDSVLASETLRFDDFLPLVRDHEVVYAQRIMALPIGCPSPLLLAAEPTSPQGIRPWDDDVQLALAYLAWAAPHAVHRSRVATLFDPDDFSPRLAEPPFVRALESFVAAAGTGPAQIVWPRRETELPLSLTVALIPGTDEAYGPLSSKWEPTDGDRHATLVASRGRLIGVTTGSRNAATAFRYAAWLVGPENARMLAAASDHVANCRGFLARAADPWFKTSDREAGKAFAAVSAEALRTPRFLFAPRLPAAEEYLAALGSRVRTAVNGQPVAEALNEAAAEWSVISERQGIDAQSEAYFRSINARPFPDADK